MEQKSQFHEMRYFLRLKLSLIEFTAWMCQAASDELGVAFSSGEV